MHMYVCLHACMWVHYISPTLHWLHSIQALHYVYYNAFSMLSDYGLLMSPHSQFTSVYSQHKGRHPTQLQHVQISDEEVRKLTWKRFCSICQEVPVCDNFYFSWCLRGQREYDPLTKPNFCPPYVTKEGFTKLKVRSKLNTW